MKWFRVIFLFMLMHTGWHHNDLLAQARLTIPFDQGWKFLEADDSLAYREAHADETWRSLDLPHDWSIEHDFSNSYPATTQGGALPMGIGWYRKSFTIPGAASGKQVFIEFDGVYRNSDVWINGHHLGNRPYGYSSFQYDMTPYLHTGNNILAVKVDNSLQPNSRWYTGSGIYRHVRLLMTNPVHFEHRGIFITTKSINPDQAVININTRIAGDSVRSYMRRITISDAQGRSVIVKKSLAKDIRVDIPKPQLWSTSAPVLYKAMIELLDANDKVIDVIEQKFGIRNFYFDKDKGFFLNDRWMKIQGVCLHHDLGTLGAAVNTDAMRRQLRILKEMGCNAIRTAHNPPAPEFLSLCDEMGFLVMVEAFDMWKKKKNKYDYAMDFEAWHTRDLADMVLRDRNHPSVFMWSIGNEIREQFDSSGIRYAIEMVNTVKAIDSTRPVISALSEWDPARNFIYRSGAMDIVGLNYHHEVYAEFQKHYPGQIFLGAENMSAFATRGHYDRNADTTMFWPARSPQKIVEKGNADFTVSAYDQVSAYWGSTHEATWKLIKKYAFLSGLFVWSGFDFIGEPIPYPWPARSSYYGIIDLAGFPKDVYYMYQSEWTDQPVLHLLPHWNWERGRMVDVWAYYSQADEVELYLNGKSLGIKRKGDDDLHVSWKVSFEPGELKIVSRKNKVMVKTAIVRTAGRPARIELIADKKQMRAGSADRVFITARVLDDKGNLVPDAGNLLHFSGTAGLQIIGTDNGYQADSISLSKPDRHAWKGLALAVVAPGKSPGTAAVIVESEGLPATRLQLQVIK